MTDSHETAGPQKPRRPRRVRTASESLLSVVIVMEIITMFFVMLTLSGLHRDQVVVTVVSCTLLIAFLLLANATLKRGVHPIAHVSQAALALPAAIDLAYAFVWVLFVIFWIACFVKGAQLDARKDTA